MKGEPKNIAEVCLATIASLCYSYFISSKIPKGKFRLLSLLPILTLFSLLPFHVTYAFPAAVIAFFVTWLASFKLILFAFDLGPLSSHPLKPLPIFIALACFPVRDSATSSSKNPPKPKKLPLNLATETLLFSVLLGLLSKFKDNIHPKIILAIYCCLVFLIVDILIFLSNAVVKTLFNLELDPPSDEPYFSTSLQDFWGKRWNLMVTNTLRHTIYRPVRSLSEPLIGRKWAPMPGIISAFVVSGLMHELIFYYVTPAVRPTWEVTCFFVLHGACVAAELAVKAAVGDRWRVSPAVATVAVVGFVVVTANWLFFPPLIRNGADERVIKEFSLFLGYVKKSFDCFVILLNFKDELM